MPIQLHERLSEFSYGYGITREVESRLRRKGLKVTPFLPSLLHEKVIGCDVSFKLHGSALLLQFKLGEELSRFRKTHPGQVKPKLEARFWRYIVDTAEPEGQFDVLLKSERNGARVFYVAPKFTSWDQYTDIYEAEEVLPSSLLLAPSKIDHILRSQGALDGEHRIIYDTKTVHVCSDPIQADSTPPGELENLIENDVFSRRQTAAESLSKIFKGLDNAREIWTQPDDPERERRIKEAARLVHFRRQRFEKIQSKSRSKNDAIFASLGMEAWTLGIQLVMATESE